MDDIDEDEFDDVSTDAVETAAQNAQESIEDINSGEPKEHPITNREVAGEKKPKKGDEGRSTNNLAKSG